ncbi:hypothetical protein NUW58_g5949 [Xylaria curta]|uniref:Uncharacterized protein n=1 Tax=Xylaria curta TaxID=42375 RepID=A0ACC1NZ49_9PEZI|nr:hypothetical protein NUW58_g5949 [Xylaria curta]
MNTNNSSGSHDGNRERQLSRHGNRTDNREKRQRSPSDSQNNRGRELFPHNIEGSNRERPQQRALGVVDIHCGFCESNTHNTGCCRRIDLPSGPVERNHGFKRWCPRHLTISHTMDECPQRWRWLADGRRVLQWLVSDCSAGPAIATNLIDWRSLLEEVPRTATILSFPWTPEFALEQKRRDAYFHTRKHFEEDPQTTSSRLREKLPWQTENGKEPQFKSFAELKRHAQWECRKLQKPMQSKQRLVAGPQEQPDERRITEPRVEKPENQQVEKQSSKEQGAPRDAMERSRIYPLLRYLIPDPLEGCLSNFITGYESCRIELIMSLWTEWLNNKELEIDFVVLAATSCKARDLGLALQASQREQPANNTNEGRVVVQAAAEFLRNNPMPEKRYIIVVDTLFPDLSAWDCSVYNSLQGWIYRSHQRRVWARICLLQPEPMGLWYGVWKAYIRCCSHSIAPEVCEREIEDCGESDEKLVGAVVSELDNISRNKANIRAVIVCPGTKFDAFSEMLPQHVSEAWHVRELSATEQEQDIQRMQQESKPTIFLLPMGIADMTRSIDGLGAILYTDEQERPVYSPTSRASPVQRGGMGRLAKLITAGAFS